jgi:hypothetical protein
LADDWHALPAEGVLQRLDTSPLCLHPDEAKARLARAGQKHRAWAFWNSKVSFNYLPNIKGSQWDAT